MTNLIDDFHKKIIDNYSKATIKSYIFELQKYEKWLKDFDTNLYDYKRSDVQQYMDYLATKKLSSATVNRIFQAIKLFSMWMKKSDTTDDIRTPKRKNYNLEAPESLSLKERNKLIRDVEKAGNKRDIAIVLTMLYTGIRVSECASLDKDDLQMSERKGNVLIRHGKGDKERNIPLHPEVRRAISIYLESRIDNDDALFVSNRCKRISVRSIQTIFEKYGVNAHKCRHTFISSLLREGKDVSLIQSLTGHSSLNMLGRYGKASEKEKQGAIDTIYS